ncbi:MAG: YlxR family protein [Streptosporangiaceae bacterium]
MVRTCVGCKERAAKSSLLRLVAVGDVIRPDPRARLPGRGAYLHPSLVCLGLARRRRAFSRALRTPGSLSLVCLAEYLGGAESPE